MGFEVVPSDYGEAHTAGLYSSWLSPSIKNPPSCQLNYCCSSLSDPAGAQVTRHLHRNLHYQFKSGAESRNQVKSPSIAADDMAITREAVAGPDRFTCKDLLDQCDG